MPYATHYGPDSWKWIMAVHFCMIWQCICQKCKINHCVHSTPSLNVLVQQWDISFRPPSSFPSLYFSCSTTCSPGKLKLVHLTFYSNILSLWSTTGYNELKVICLPVTWNVKWPLQYKKDPVTFTNASLEIVRTTVHCLHTLVHRNSNCYYFWT